MSAELKIHNQLNEAPLFKYLEEKQSEEFAIQTAKTNVASLRNFYTTNFILVLTIILSICIMFYVQYKVDNVQKRIDIVQGQIEDYENEIKLLNIEWVYLTRPSRLRFLSRKYLKKNDNIAFSQITTRDKLRKFYLANLEKYNNENNIVDIGLNTKF